MRLSKLFHKWRGSKADVHDEGNHVTDTTNDHGSTQDHDQNENSDHGKKKRSPRKSSHGFARSFVGGNLFRHRSFPLSKKETPTDEESAAESSSRRHKSTLVVQRSLYPAHSYSLYQAHSYSFDMGNSSRTREYSTMVRPEFDTLFTLFPGMSEDKFVGKLKKVTVVGVGNVGMAVAQTILTEKLTDTIALVARSAEKLRGEMLDLQHAAAFMPTVEIIADTDYKVTEDSDICIITAGARQQEGQDRLALVDENVEVLKDIIPELVRYSPNTIFLVISNPVDILSWVTWKLSGFPPNRVLGTGTNLDSSRFRFLLANHFQVSAQNVHAHILGEHGDSSVPVWSSVRIAGVPVTAFLLNKGVSNDTDVLRMAHRAVVEGAYEVIKLKGYTSWAIGYSAAWLVSSILRNQRKVHPCSVLAQGFHGIKEEVFISLPVMLGRFGVHAVVNSEFDPDETRQLHESAAQIWDIQKNLKLGPPTSM